jgi:hypothetical protein
MVISLSVDRTRYKVRVLSLCDVRRYGCEYDIDVGLAAGTEAEKP